MKRKGAVFLITVIILSIVTIIGAGLSIMMTRDVFTARRLRVSMQAYFLAEAGIEESICDLYDNGFVFDNFPKNKDLGNGSFYAVLDTSKYIAEKLIKITSTGTIGEVSRTVSVIVKDARISAFTYGVLSGGKMWIAGNSDVDHSVHSNSNSQSWLSPACRIGGILFTGATIHGDATACGTVNVTWLGTVTGSALSNQPSVAMPPFDDAFWNYYYQLALASGNVYSGTKTFTSNPNPANGVVWVNGEVRLQGTWTLTGTIIATGPIIFNKWTSGTITRVPKTGYENFPAFMSKNSYVYIWDPAVINGLVYAGSYITILSIDRPRDVVINGAAICNGQLTMFFTDLNYTEPNPPGIVIPPPLKVICWSP